MKIKGVIEFLWLGFVTLLFVFYISISPVKNFLIFYTEVPYDLILGDSWLHILKD